MDAVERLYHEQHDFIEGDMPPCVGQWCCGCDVHPIAKPWGWNHKRWEAHYTEHHPADLHADWSANFPAITTSVCNHSGGTCPACAWTR